MWSGYSISHHHGWVQHWMSRSIGFHSLHWTSRFVIHMRRRETSNSKDEYYQDWQNGGNCQKSANGQSPAGERFMHCFAKITVPCRVCWMFLKETRLKFSIYKRETILSKLDKIERWTKLNFGQNWKIGQKLDKIENWSTADYLKYTYNNLLFLWNDLENSSWNQGIFHCG